MHQTQEDIEGIDPKAIFALITSAREKTWKAVEDISQMMTPGMTEKEAIQKANSYLAENGVRKFWHKTHVRFGKSTTLGFDDPYLDNVILKEDDIFYIDLGPIWNGIEGDCGNTFMVGQNLEYLKIQTDVRQLFAQTRDFWKEAHPCGKEMCAYAYEEAKKRGYVMHPSYVKGHRLSEFSHARYSNLPLFDMEFEPSADRWVLELQICHPSMEFGAFYEDILL